jgi:hypothetical protein
MPEETPVDSLPADEPGATVESPLSPDVAPYWLAALIDSAGGAIIAKPLDGRITGSVAGITSQL